MENFVVDIYLFSISLLSRNEIINDVGGPGDLNYSILNGWIIILDPYFRKLFKTIITDHYFR